MPEKVLILVAEPEEAIREAIQYILNEEGYQCDVVSDKKSLDLKCAVRNYQLIIVDIKVILNQIEDFTAVLQERDSRPPVLVTLHYEEIGEMHDLMQHGIGDYMLKPFQFDDLLERIQKLIELHRSGKS